MVVKLDNIGKKDWLITQLLRAHTVLNRSFAIGASLGLGNPNNNPQATVCLTELTEGYVNINLSLLAL